MTQPLVSVLLPVHNGGRALLLAVWSILGQTLRDWELLVLDDGSTDAALAPLGRLADERVRIVRDPVRRGLAGRLNLGIELARGRYFARMDHDDVAFPERLRKQVGFLEEHGDVDLLGTRALVFSREGKALGLFPFQQNHERICRRPWLGFHLPHPTWMGRADWFRRHRYRIPEQKRAEDQDLLLRSYAMSRFACLPDVLLGYRISEAGLGKLLTARMSVGRAQLRAHLRGGRPALALLGVSASLAKAGVDTALTVLGRTLHTARSLERPVELPVLAEWERLWHAGGEWVVAMGKTA
jgi:glycosyltransferase involved in cell wall biosynthesis